MGKMMKEFYERPSPSPTDEIESAASSSGEKESNCEETNVSGASAEPHLPTIAVPTPLPPQPQFSQLLKALQESLPKQWHHRRVKIQAHRFPKSPRSQSRAKRLKRRKLKKQRKQTKA